MIKRILSLLLGAGLIAFAIWLGAKVRPYHSDTIWLAVAAAILILISLIPISYAIIPATRLILGRLSTPSEIDKLASTVRDRIEKDRVRAKEGSIITLSFEGGFAVAFLFFCFAFLIDIFVFPNRGPGRSESTVEGLWFWGAAILGFGVGFVTTYRHVSKVKSTG